VPISQKCFGAVLNPGAVFGEIEADNVGDARAVADGSCARHRASIFDRGRGACALRATPLENTETVTPPYLAGLEKGESGGRLVTAK
jgi:hypothetical protein